jgi:hypothetical protein
MTDQLKVGIEQNEIVIRIPFDYLKHASETHENFQDDAGDNRLVVEQVDTFAREVATALQEESDDGTTLVHTALDDAIFQAIENGAEGATLLDDLYDDENEE